MGSMTTATAPAMRDEAERLLRELAGPDARLREDQWTAIEALVAEHGLTTGASALRRNAMACVALPTCGLALAESERYLPDLVTALEKAFALCGCPPQVLRCDNGPEFISEALRTFCEDQVGTDYVPPGQPWKNGYIESFNNRVRDECLNMNEFHSLLEARVVIEDWKEDYNNRHSSLAYRTPNEYAASYIHTN